MDRDFDFFRRLILAISSSLELEESLQATFAVLKEGFPIAGLTLHRFLPEMKALCFDILVTESGVMQLDRIVPLEKEEIEIIEQHEQSRVVLQSNLQGEGDALDEKMAALLDDSVSIPLGDYLVTILDGGDDVVGHFCLVGSSSGCFSAGHRRLLKLIQPSVSLAMANMLHHKRTEELRLRLDRQRRQLAGKVELLTETALIGRDGGLKKTMHAVEQLAGRETPVLILGETGTGKEMIADMVQRISPRKEKPYVKVNCGAIPESLIDSELFGHVKGAFTGATTDRPGKFEQAHGGTLFLDEVGELSLQAQVRLLRVLQEGEVVRVGGVRSIPVDVRIIAATNRPLEQMVRESTFREDLYYRLNVFPVQLPPLRQRQEDLPLLVSHFVQELSRSHGLSGVGAPVREELAKLQQYPWPGNIRELKNLVERALTLAPEGALELSSYLLPEAVPGFGGGEEAGLELLVERKVEEALQRLGGVDGAVAPGTGSASRMDGALLSAEDILPLDAVISNYIEQVLEFSRGKISGAGGAAELLEVNSATLRNRMRKLNIPFGAKRAGQGSRAGRAFPVEVSGAL